MERSLLFSHLLQNLKNLHLLARLDEVQEKLLYYPQRRVGVGIDVGAGVDVSKMLKFLR